MPPHRLHLSINSKGSFICTSTERITHTTAFVTPVVEHWLEREILNVHVKTLKTILKPNKNKIGRDRTYDNVPNLA